MSFNFLLKSSSNKSHPLQIRKEVVTTKASVAPRSSSSVVARQGEKRPWPKQTKERSSISSEILSKKHNVSRKRRTPSQGPVDFGSDESEADGDLDPPRKKPKQQKSDTVDTNRNVRSSIAFSEDCDGVFTMVHAADIPLLDKSTKYIPSFDGLSEGTEVSLQYPSASQKERYLLVRPKSVRTENNDFNAIEDIIHVMRKVIEHYLPESEQSVFNHESSGFPQRLIRAANHQSENDIKEIILDWNTALSRSRADGIISKVLDERHCVHPKLVERILSQSSARTVSLGVKSLREYENGTDNVYGELLPRFVSDILHKDTMMKSDQVFVDLGSGVGNVVFQAALEIGCESWGCEMMKNACDLAARQQTEFEARCRLWGLASGQIHLERGDFLVNAAIAKVLPRADVVLVNNQAFTPQLNERLTSLFLDLKEGCLIVSLKSFVPAGHKISARNLNSPFNILEVEQKEYYSDCVSWTDAPGTYFVSRKDMRKIRAFSVRNT
ncbi:Nucleosomal histone H3-Lys79 methylase [Ptychographa xylographoides]|nr:Nucleosomal histone H3-Lys79 methylase [Ptychographa xylographoides]